MEIQNPSFHVSLDWNDHTTAIANFGRCHAQKATGALRALEAMPWFDGCSSLDGLAFDGCSPFGAPVAFDFGRVPHCGCLCPPRMECSGPPAGQGLQKEPEGFPPGSVRTAGGYTVVPGQGPQGWSIFGPGKEMKDGPLTNVWGDPHVNESDGTRWDFTKNSNFRLPDGTLIGVQTTSQQGASVTKSLDIVNGADRASITGIDANQPKTSEISYDGYEFRNELVSSEPERDTFVLGGDGKSVQWFQERNGEMRGLVTGATVNAQGNYEQTLDKDAVYSVDPGLTPAVGSAAWGNELRSEITDDVARSAVPQDLKDAFASFVGMDHEQAQRADVATAWPSWFGGLPNSFSTLDDAFGAVHGLGLEVLSFARLSSGIRTLGLPA